MMTVKLLSSSALTKNFAPIVRVLSLSASTKTRRRQRWHQPKGHQTDGPTVNNVFAQDEAENLDALEHFINQDRPERNSRHLEHNTAVLIQRELQQQQRTLKKKILERKYFKQPQEVNLLTWKAKEQIIYLHNEFPEEWTPEYLAKSFPISLEGVQRLLRSSYKPRTEEELQKHDKRVAANWRRLKETLAIDGGPVQSDISHYQHVTDTGKLPLMINAGGSSHLPMPQSRTTGKKLLHGGQRQMGVFESIVADSDFVRAYEDKMVKKRAHLQADLDKLLKEIAESGKRHRDGKVKTAYIEDRVESLIE